MKKIFITALVLCSAQLALMAQPNIGIGFRLGDLTGLSVKKNFGDNALELSVGRLLRHANPNYREWFYDKKYDDYYYNYDRAQLGVPLGLALHFLKHRTLDFADPLRWYYGIGAQARMYPVEYIYYYRVDQAGFVWEERSVRRRSFEAGIDWVLGLEHNFPEVPIGVFLDVNLYMEIYDNPFFAWGQAGIGVRYNF